MQFPFPQATNNFCKQASKEKKKRKSMWLQGDTCETKDIYLYLGKLLLAYLSGLFMFPRCLLLSGLCLCPVCVCKCMSKCLGWERVRSITNASPCPQTQTHTQVCVSACVLQQTDDFPCRPQWKASFLPASTQIFCSLSSAWTRQQWFIIE